VHLRHIPVAIGTCLGRFPLVNPAIAQRHVFPLKMWHIFGHPMTLSLCKQRPWSTESAHSL
jgi:hypothetical protein